MFEITANIYNGNQLVKYEILDTNTNQKKIMSIDMVQGLAIADALTNAKFNEYSNTLTGKNNFDLRSLPRKQEQIKKNNEIIANYLYGEKLLKFITQNTELYPNERYLLNNLMQFLDNPCKGNICALYGLRRTGKTVMMYHSIKRLFKSGIDNIAFITLTENDSLAYLFKKIEEFVNKGIEYIFLDEVTAVNGFIQSSALLADTYAKTGIHIVIAGTDSYVINIAGQNNLYDRMVTINTTYIGFKEYTHLNPKTDILDYIHIGGVLPADIFYDNDKTKDYINTAISGNIINSLLRANNKKQYKHLMELDGRGLLKKAIEQAIVSANEELTTNVITETYFNSSIGSAKQMIANIFDIDAVLDIDEVEERIRYKLSIVKDFDTDISDDYIEELRDFLIDIGAIKMYHRYVCTNKRIRKVEVPIFVQPGLRYHQTVALLNSLCETSSYFNINKKTRQLFLDKIIEDIEGNLIEHEVILSELMKYSDKEFEVTQLIYNSKEIDMIIHNNDTIYLFEIKRNNSALEEQAKWLVNKEVCNYIEDLFGCRIDNKIVLYLGEDTEKIVNGETIQYKNINEFLIE
ncbi:MAG: AAA family ATPase [Lachnospiraceae bacterium]|nr:AAA family ATPase [Lachnospiraceae bacterium]